MIWEVLAIVVPLAITGAAWFLKKRYAVYGQAIIALEEGVMHAWKEYGRDRKSALREEVADPEHERTSSKFEEADIAKLTMLATSKAMDMMSSSNKSLSSTIAPSKWGDEIKKAIERVKSK